LKYDAILLTGFGGPEKPGDVIPFLEDVTKNRAIPAERLHQIARNYEKIGGSSPYNRLTREQAQALEKLLKTRGLDIPVSVGFAHCSPRIPEVLTELAQRGKTKIFVIVMAPHRSPVSYDKYLDLINDTLKAIRSKGLNIPEITYAPSWHIRPGFIRAIADCIREAYSYLTPTQKEHGRTELVFTTHSLPLKMAQESAYLQQFEETIRHITQLMDVPHYQTAYTSRSGKPNEVWMEPDLGDWIDHMGDHSLSACVVAPVGFLVDHMEVLYDIDTLAQEKAKHRSIHMVRANTVGLHPSFIAMLASLVEESLS
jgi:ferrochelatase